MAECSDLTSDILSDILKRIKNPSDHIRCSSVSSSWRSVSRPHRSTLPQSVPGLMVFRSNSLKRKFIDFNKDNALPFDHHRYSKDDHGLLDVLRSEKCCGSYQGWLVITTLDRGSRVIYLRNPFLKGFRFLPALEESSERVYKAVLSSSPSFDEKTAVLVLFETSGAAFCRLGDESWKELMPPEYRVGFTDGVFLEGRFYVVDDYGKIYTVNDRDLHLQEIEVQPESLNDCVRYKWYLVEVEGQLCRVLRKFSSDEGFYYKCYDDSDNKGGSRVSTIEFRVWKMDSSTNEWVLISDLGNNSLFLGGGNPVCLKASEIGGMINGNKIYFTDDRHRTKHFGDDHPGRDLGVYDMMDKSFGRLYTDPLYELSEYPPAVWVTPLPW